MKKKLFKNQFKFIIQAVKMSNRSNLNRSRDAQPNHNRDDLNERREHTNRIFNEMIDMSRQYADIDSSERFRAQQISADRDRRRWDARREARLAPMGCESESDRDRMVQREVERTRARVCAIEEEAVKSMEREREKERSSAMAKSAKKVEDWLQRK